MHTPAESLVETTAKIFHGTLKSHRVTRFTGPGAKTYFRIFRFAIPSKMPMSLLMLHASGQTIDKIQNALRVLNRQ